MYSVLISVLILINGINCMPKELKESKNDCDINRIDRCAQKLYIYGDPDFKVAKTVEEAKEFCR